MIPRYWGSQRRTIATRLYSGSMKVAEFNEKMEWGLRDAEKEVHKYYGHSKECAGQIVGKAKERRQVFLKEFLLEHCQFKCLRVKVQPHVHVLKNEKDMEKLIEKEN